MEEKKPAKTCPLPWIVGLGLLFALFMGPGPGLHLINPDSKEATRTLLGMPIVYAWGLMWFAVQVALLLTAAFRIWSRSED